jgi:glycosyltransferase involved in cell wall biosynthesis
MKLAYSRQTVAVLLDGFSSWAGGIDLIRVFVSGLLTDPQVRVVLMIPRPRLRGILLQFVLSAVSRFRHLVGTNAASALPQPLEPREVAERFAEFDDRVTITYHSNSAAGLCRAVKLCNVDVALPAFAALAANFPLPWIGYILDFQHRYLPQFFSEEERQVRDLRFERMVQTAPVIICNSRAVRDDIERFYAGAAHNTLSLPFTPTVKREWLELDPEPVRTVYDVPLRYFIICNQFWLHKDHTTAFRAFAQYRVSGPFEDVALVCTGEMHDWRFPQYGDEIRCLIADLGLETAVHLLGHIPKIDQIALVQGSIGVLQPTLFEGGPGGGATNDAVALGVPVLLSDIPINREIVDPCCRFFPPQDHAALASLMAQVAAKPPSRPPAAALAAENLTRTIALGAALKDAINLAIRKHPRQANT